MRTALCTPALAVLGLALWPLRAAAERPTLTNVTAQFHPGPYNAMTVDQRDSQRVAVVTSDGHVMWSHDAGYNVGEAQAAQGRTLDPITLRGEGGRSLLSNSASDDDEDDLSQKDEQETGVASVQRGILWEDKPDREMSQFLLMHYMQNGIPPVRWFAWMGIPQFMPMFSNIALPSGDGPMFMAGAGGIYGSDKSRRSWMRILGPSNFYPSDKDEWGIAVTVDPRNPKHVLASTDRGLMVSTNGGATFAHPKVQAIQDLVINQFLWTNDTQLYIAAYGEILVSNDSGDSFESVTAIEGDINHMAVRDGMLYLATTDGAWIAPVPAKEQAPGEAPGPPTDSTAAAQPTAAAAAEPVHVLAERNVVGIVPWRNGDALIATNDELFLRTAAGKMTSLLSAGRDPILSLQGNPDRAWLLTQTAVFAVGAPVPRKASVAPKAPRLRLGLTALEDQVIKHYDLKPPRRLGNYSLLPTISVSVGTHVTHQYSVMYDATFPVSFRQWSEQGWDKTHWSVVANWDLARLVFGRNGKSNNAYSMIDTGIRDAREKLMTAVRENYRTASELVRALERPPADPKLELLWRWRLEEIATYLETLTGTVVVSDIGTDFYQATSP